MGKKSIYFFMVLGASSFQDLSLFAVENLKYQNNELGGPECQIVD